MNELHIWICRRAFNLGEEVPDQEVLAIYNNVMEVTSE